MPATLPPNYQSLDGIKEALEDAVNILGGLDLESLVRPEAACGQGYMEMWQESIWTAHRLTQAMIKAQRAYDRQQRR